MDIESAVLAREQVIKRFLPIWIHDSFAEAFFAEFESEVLREQDKPHG